MMVGFNPPSNKGNKSMVTNTKIAYEAPSIEKVGDFGSVTLAAGVGDFLDANYPITTPKSELTFSN
jgi:hypothetical protein